MGNRFQKGDYVVFVARQDDDVPCGCNEIMEATLYGKVFLVDSVDEYDDGVQSIRPSVCDLTDNPDECILDWNFSSPMFELYEEAEKTDGALDMTFDDFCREVQNA